MTLKKKKFRSNELDPFVLSYNSDKCRMFVQFLGKKNSRRTKMKQRLEKTDD